MITRWLPNGLFDLERCEDRPIVENPPWSDLFRLWDFIMFIAIRDQASSVHYHPWKTWELSMVVGNDHYEMVPLPPHWARRIALSAAMIMSGKFGRFLRTQFHWPVQAQGVVRFESLYGSIDFIGSVWNDRRWYGVDWFRVDTADDENLPTYQNPLEVRAKRSAGA
ncbi:MAG: hypothetical protein ACRC8S_14060 [Fimbriiglobus sp.]